MGSNSAVGTASKKELKILRVLKKSVKVPRYYSKCTIRRLNNKKVAVFLKAEMGI